MLSRQLAPRCHIEWQGMRDDIIVDGADVILSGAVRVISIA